MTQTASSRSAFGAAVRALVKRPSILLPFAAVAFVQWMVVVIAYVGPHSPLRAVVAPPLEAFFGAGALRYPGNFLVLPHLLSAAHFPIALLVSPLMAGAVALLARAYWEKDPLRWHEALRMAGGRYIALFLISALVLGLVRAAGWGAEGLLESRETGAALPAAVFLAGFLVETLFVYAVPALLAEGRSFISALGRSFWTVLTRPIATAFLMLPALAVFGGLYALNLRGMALIENRGPDVVIPLLFLNVLAGFLVNTYTNAAAALVLLQRRPAAAPAAGVFPQPLPEPN